MCCRKDIEYLNKEFCNENQKTSHSFIGDIDNTVLETPGIPVTGTPSINSPCHEELFWVEECLLYEVQHF